MFHILAAIHHRPSALGVRNHAVELAKACGANIHVFHACGQGENEEAETDWLLRHYLGLGLPDERVHAHSAAGETVAAILAEADRVDADLIIMGRIAGRPLGDGAPEQVMASAKCPLLVVPINPAILVDKGMEKGATST